MDHGQEERSPDTVGRRLDSPEEGGLGQAIEESTRSGEMAEARMGSAMGHSWPGLELDGGR